MSVKDDLAGVLADSLNKKFKDYKVAYFLDGAQETPTDIKEFISTGSTMLDLAISNRPNGGIAVGRITELNGLESSGKSLVGAHLLSETQKKGGVAVYIDTETAVSTDFLEAIGVDVESMLYLHLETVEDIFSAIEEIVAKVRESDKNRLVTILVDSLAAATTKVELDADFEGYLKPLQEDLRILQEVSEAVFHGEISLGIGVDWLEAETGKSMSRPGLKKYVDKVYGR